jgi:hypothetical protein
MAGKKQLAPKGKAAFNYVKGVLKTMPLQQAIFDHKNEKYQFNPDKVVDLRADAWMTWWTREPDKNEMLSQLCQLLQDARAAPKDKLITAKMVREAAYTLSDGTGKGADDMSPIFVKRLPPAAFQELADIYNLCEDAVGWPKQLLAIIVTLMSKESGGERPIGLTPMATRIYFKIRRWSLPAWTAEKRGDWDDAIAGNSSLRAAVLRSMEIDTAVVHHEQWGVDIAGPLQVLRHNPDRPSHYCCAQIAIPTPRAGSVFAILPQRQNSEGKQGVQYTSLPPELSGTRLR